MKIWRRCLGIAMVVVLLSSGCGPTLGESFKKIESIPYRPFGSVGFMWPVDVLANGKVAVTLPHASYYPYFVEPGEIEFRSKRTGTFSESITLDAKAGRTYYLKTIIRAGALVFCRPNYSNRNA